MYHVAGRSRQILADVVGCGQRPKNLVREVGNLCPAVGHCKGYIKKYVSHETYQLAAAPAPYPGAVPSAWRRTGHRSARTTSRACPWRPWASRRGRTGCGSSGAARPGSRPSGGAGVSWLWVEKGFALSE